MRTIKFRGISLDTGKWLYGYLVMNENKDVANICHKQGINEMQMSAVDPLTVGQFTGLHDKNGVEIYEGDRIQYREPYRTTQTHTGNNIPNGSYTEPMEPGIRTHTGIVIYKEGMFQFQDDDNDTEFPLIFCITDWDLDSIETAISYNRPDRFIFNDPEEGDLQYLITECAKVETSEQLIEYLNGVEVIGNIYQHPNLIK